MREKIIQFGPRDGILGILSEPERAQRIPDAPVVVASNVGLNHRVGPFRLYVDLARKLAACGYSMLRFDLSGMGESAPRQDAIDDIKRAVLDVEAAMEMLTKRVDAKRFVQLGMCSGVDSVHTVSTRDARVAGAIFLEGYAFRTPRFYAHRYLRRPLSRRFWEMYVGRKYREHFAKNSDVREAGDVEEIYTRAYPSKAELRRDYRTMTKRGTDMLFVFAGGLASDYAYNYTQQFADTFGSVARDPHVEVEFYPRADHLYSVQAHRAALLERIERWMQSHYR